MNPLEVQADPFPTFSRTTARYDGLVNPFLGYGTDRDKLGSGSFAPGLQLTDYELDALYYFSDLGALIVDARPEEMFRTEYKLCSPKNEDKAHELKTRGDELGLDAKLLDALKFARLRGGAIVIVGALDGATDLTKPLDVARVREVRYLNVVDRRMCSVVQWQTDPMQSGYGDPEIYAVGGYQDSPPQRIHASRVIRFEGVKPDPLRQRQLAGWGYSVLQRPYDVIRQFETGFGSSAQLVSDASQAVWKIKDLVDLIANNREALQARLALSDMSRSAGRGIMVDAENEDFTRVATSFAGVPDVLDRFMMRLASATRMPVTLLMGRSPAGQNATGDSDFRAWYDSVDKDRESILEPAIKRFYEILSAGTLDDLDVEFEPLWSPSDSEQATTDKTRAETRKIYVDMGALLPEEVALADFGSGNGEIEIDEASLKKSLEAERKLLASGERPPAPGEVNPNAPNAGEPTDPTDASKTQPAEVPAPNES